MPLRLFLAKGGIRDCSRQDLFFPPSPNGTARMGHPLVCGGEIQTFCTLDRAAEVLFLAGNEGSGGPFFARTPDFLPRSARCGHACGFLPRKAAGSLLEEPSSTGNLGFGEEWDTTALKAPPGVNSIAGAAAGSNCPGLPPRVSWCTTDSQSRRSKARKSQPVGDNGRAARA